MAHTPKTVRDTTVPLGAAAGAVGIDLRDPAGRLPGEVVRHRSRLKAAMSQLDSALAAGREQPATTWLSSLGDACTTLSEALRRHVALHEGPDSFHSEILRAQPHLAPRVSWLQRDHAQLHSHLESFRRQIDLAGSTAVPTAELHRAGNALLHLFSRHRRRGADVVWDAFEFDLGGEH